MKKQPIIVAAVIVSALFLSQLVGQVRHSERTLGGGGSGSSYIGVKNLTTVTFTADEVTVIPFDFVGLQKGMSVDANGHFLVDVSGDYSVTVQARVANITSSGQKYESFMWLQRSTDGGTTWANLPNRGVGIDLKDRVGFQTMFADLTANDGDQLRVVARVSNADVRYAATPADAQKPITPSVAARILKL